MKQLILLAIITLFSTASFAQKNKEHHAQAHHDQLLSHSAELNLSAEQTAKLTQLNNHFRSAMQTLKQNETLAATEKQERMHLLQKQYRDSSKAVLTAEQNTKLKSIREDSTHMNTKHMEKKELQDSLNLTEEQVAKLKEMQAKDHAEILKIQQDSSVTEANKKFRVEELKKERRKEMESILTPDQQRKYKEMRNRKPKNDVKQ